MMLRIPIPATMQRDGADQPDDERQAREDAVDGGRERLAVDRLVHGAAVFEAIEVGQDGAFSVSRQPRRDRRRESARPSQRAAAGVVALVGRVGNEDVALDDVGRDAAVGLGQHADDRVAAVAGADRTADRIRSRCAV